MIEITNPARFFVATCNVAPTGKGQGEGSTDPAWLMQSDLQCFAHQKLSLYSVWLDVCISLQFEC